MMAWMKHVMGIWAERSSMASSKIAFTSLRCLSYTKTLQIQTVTSVTKNVTQSRESILFIYLCTSLNKWFDNLSSNPDWKLSRRYRFEEWRLSSLRLKPFILKFLKIIIKKSPYISKMTQNRRQNGRSYENNRWNSVRIHWIWSIARLSPMP